MRCNLDGKSGKGRVDNKGGHYGERHYDVQIL